MRWRGEGTVGLVVLTFQTKEGSDLCGPVLERREREAPGGRLRRQQASEGLTTRTKLRQLVLGLLTLLANVDLLPCSSPLPCAQALDERGRHSPSAVSLRRRCPRASSLPPPFRSSPACQLLLTKRSFSFPRLRRRREHRRFRRGSRGLGSVQVCLERLAEGAEVRSFCF